MEPLAYPLAYAAWGHSSMRCGQICREAHRGRSSATLIPSMSSTAAAEQTGGSPATILNLPEDALRLIGEHVAAPAQDLCLSCKDAAACMMSCKGMALVGAAAWARCSRIAETYASTTEYLDSWGAELPDGKQLSRTRVHRLARASPRICASSPLWHMRMVLRVGEMSSDEYWVDVPNVGESCPISNHVAYFLLEVSQAVVNIAVPCPVFRDKDVSACPVRVRGPKRLVRLRDAILAPAVDRGRKITESMRRFSDLDSDFRAAGARRQWREKDLALRLRVDRAKRWAESVNAQTYVRSAVIISERNGFPVDYESFTIVVRAYHVAGLIPTSMYCFLRGGAVSDPISEARGDIYDQLQRSVLGHIMFRMDSATIMPGLEPCEIEEARNDLLFHAIARQEALSYIGPRSRLYHDIRDALVMADSVESANRVLAHFLLHAREEALELL